MCQVSSTVHNRSSDDLGNSVTGKKSVIFDEREREGGGGGGCLNYLAQRDCEAKGNT